MSTYSLDDRRISNDLGLQQSVAACARTHVVMPRSGWVSIQSCTGARWLDNYAERRRSAGGRNEVGHAETGPRGEIDTRKE